MSQLHNHGNSNNIYEFTVWILRLHNVRICVCVLQLSPVRKMRLKCCLTVERGKHITYIGVEHTQNTLREQQKHNSADRLIGQYRVPYVKQLMKKKQYFVTSYCKEWCVFQSHVFGYLQQDFPY